MMTASQAASHLTIVSRKTRNKNPIKCSDCNENTFFKCFQPSQLLDLLSEPLHPLMG